MAQRGVLRCLDGAEGLVGAVTPSSRAVFVKLRVRATDSKVLSADREGKRRRLIRP